VNTWSTPVVKEEKKLIPCALCGSSSFKPSLSPEAFSYVRCSSCSLVQVNPQPVAAEVKRRYGENYLAYELANEENFLNLELLALADTGFDELKTGSILDIGCATGCLLAVLRDKGWKTTGVEISVPQAEYGRKTRNLDISHLSLEENRFPNQHFDVVHASHLIEHLNDPPSLVREVHRVLKPHGRFFVTTPNIAGFQARLFRNRWRSAIFDHLYLFSVATLSRLLNENGFEIEKTVTWGGLAAGSAPLPLKRVVDKAAKRFGFGDVVAVKAKPRLRPDT